MKTILIFALLGQTLLALSDKEIFNASAGVFNHNQLETFANQNLSSLDKFVIMRLSLMNSSQRATPLSLMSLDPKLSSHLTDLLKKLEIRKSDKADSVPPSWEEINSLMEKKKAGDKRVDLSDEQMKALSLCLQAENEKRLNSKASDEEVLQNIAKRNLAIFEKDTKNASIQPPPKLLEELRAALPENEILKKDNLTASEFRKVLDFIPKGKLSKEAWFNIASQLGEKNYRENGNEFRWDVARDLYFQDPLQRKIGVPPTLGRFNQIRNEIESAINKFDPEKDGAPFQKPGHRRQFHRLGEGPKLGGQKGGGARDFHQDRKGPPPTDGTKGADLACVNALRAAGRYSTEVEETFEHQTGVTHCTLSFIAKDPNEAKEKCSANHGGDYLANAALAKHCVYEGKLNGLTIPVNGHVLHISEYALQVQSTHEPINGGDDGALLTLKIPCSEAVDLPIVRAMNPEEYKGLGGNPFGVLIARNCNINEDTALQNCAILAEASKADDNFLHFNSHGLENKYNHGQVTEVGDSGGGLIACDANQKPVWVGATSFILGDPGHHGGAASGKFLNFIDSRLPVEASGPLVQRSPSGGRDERPVHEEGPVERTRRTTE